LTKAAADRLDLSEEKVEQFLELYPQQIRFINDREQKKTSVALELVNVARMYGARKTIPKNVLKECIELILDRFKTLSTFEIRLAYRLWSIGDLEVKGAEMYGGEFNAMQLGKVLGAFLKGRKPLVAGVITAAEEIKEEEQRREKKEAAKRSFLKAFNDRLLKAIEKYKENPDESGEPWRHIPDYYYQSAFDRNYFSYEEGEKWEIWQIAQSIAKIDFQKALTAMSLGEKRRET